MVVMGGKFVLEGHELPRSKCATRLLEFKCPSGHCVRREGLRSVFRIYRTISLALQQMGDHFRHIKIGISPPYGFWLKPEVRRVMANYYPHDQISHRVTNLQLTLSASETQFRELGIHDLVENANVDTLELQYVDNDSHAHGKIHVVDLKFPALKRKVLKSLCATPSAWDALMNIHGSRLTHVSLCKCSIAVPFRPADLYLVANRRSSDTQMWLAILSRFGDCSNLECLHLERLRIMYEGPFRHTFPLEHHPFYPVTSMNTDMSLCGRWIGKEEIEKALQVLNNQSDCFHFIKRARYPPEGSRNAGLPPALVDQPTEDKHFLNLRFANFKASLSAYGWTPRETEVLNSYRHCGNPFVDFPAQDTTPFDNSEDFPTRYGTLCRCPEISISSNGHLALPLPHLLWGKWATVWLRRTPYSSEVIGQMLKTPRGKPGAASDPLRYSQGL